MGDTVLINPHWLHLFGKYLLCKKILVVNLKINIDGYFFLYIGNFGLKIQLLGFYGILTFVGYLMPNPFLYK